MAKVRLGDVSKLINGDRGKNYPSQADITTEEGEIPFVNAGHLNGRNINLNEMNYISRDKYDRLNSGKFQQGDILYCLRGSLGKKALVNKNISGAIASSLVIIRPDTGKVNGEYLMMALDSPTIQEQLKKANNGSSQPNLSAGSVRDYLIELPDLSVQDEMVEKLVKVRNLIDDRKQELQSLNDLIKARFVEMFGDPLINSLGLHAKPMTEVCEIIDGDRGKNYPSADDFTDKGYCLFLNAKNVTSSGFNFDTCMFVSKEKDECLRKGKLKRGDVVLTTRGTLGNLAFYTDDIPFEHVRINSGMVILRMKHDIVDEVYFIEQFKMLLEDIKEKIASGSAQPQLPISTMNKINIMVSDVKHQKIFADFVQQVDKSKVAVQKALDQTQILFDSLMQKYFG